MGMILSVASIPINSPHYGNDFPEDYGSRCFWLGWPSTVVEIVRVSSSSGYRLVKLASGAHSIHSLAHRETFHPVIGPVAEAEALYVRQLKVAERLKRHAGDFVVWDVGLGAAANVLTFLRHTREIPPSIHLLSFDQTLEPLEFALQHREALGYLDGFELPLRELLEKKRVTFANGSQTVTWEVHVADFPGLLNQPAAAKFAKPHAIMFDAFSPAKNPAMWTLPLFTKLFKLLDPARQCALPTYSRSTILRVTLLLAGFFVGAGHATGEKEETTIAANTLDLIEEPLGHKWLERAHRSTSAEPLREPIYKQTALISTTWEQLREHPQFR
jgi:tRNA U34 5-methylaminomethyl-2-thiouridine-forming methyltransferase MnmC